MWVICETVPGQYSKWNRPAIQISAGGVILQGRRSRPLRDGAVICCFCEWSIGLGTFSSPWNRKVYLVLILVSFLWFNVIQHSLASDSPEQPELAHRKEQTEIALSVCELPLFHGEDSVLLRYSLKKWSFLAASREWSSFSSSYLNEKMLKGVSSTPGFDWNCTVWFLWDHFQWQVL